MKMTEHPKCPLCGGKVEGGTTTFTVDYETGVLVVRHVPANVCTQCGESWISDSIAGELEVTLENSKSQRRQFAVVDMAA